LYVLSASVICWRFDVKVTSVVTDLNQKTRYHAVTGKINARIADMMIISPLTHARQSATVTVSDNLPDKLRAVRHASSRILCLRKGLCHSFHPCKHTAQASAVLCLFFSRLVYAIHD
jgi:hypothetical protein